MGMVAGKIIRKLKKTWRKREMTESTIDVKGLTKRYGELAGSAEAITKCGFVRMHFFSLRGTRIIEPRRCVQ
jgi:hypothetical protein